MTRVCRCGEIMIIPTSVPAKMTLRRLGDLAELSRPLDEYWRVI